MTFLIVLKETHARRRYQEAIENRGHGCLTARDVDDAALTIRLARLDAMALDLDGHSNKTMEWLAGLSLEEDPISARCVLLAGPPVAPQLRLRASACGARVLEHPVSPERLLAALEQCAHRPAAGPDRARGGPAPSQPAGGEVDREH